MTTSKPLILCILDGFSLGDQKNKYNAVALADTPNLDHFLTNYPNTFLVSFFFFLELPEGQMGNSEVGHTMIGSGRFPSHALNRIDKALATFPYPELLNHIIEDNSGGAVHLIGLVSSGGIHSLDTHTLKLIEILAVHKKLINLHIITDGRDTPPNIAASYLESTLKVILQYSNVKLATVSGRYYAMDRDERLERTKMATDVMLALTSSILPNNSPKALSEYLQKQYSSNIYDEFILPARFADYKGIQDNDILLFTNFRSDRMRQTASYLANNSKAKCIYTITNYFADAKPNFSIPIKHIIEDEDMPDTLAEILERNGKRQLHIAESEKYPHVTFFFNGGKEKPYELEHRVMVPSPKVSTYDLQPEMSAGQVTEEVLKGIEENYDFIVVNFANCDMVGHTGNLMASIKAVETIDACIRKITNSVLEKDGTIIITADHGNVEEMKDKNNVIHTQHTVNPVPFMLINKNFTVSNTLLKEGTLIDVAPTILFLMNLPVSKHIKGKNLIES